MGIVGWLLMGLIAGAVARMLVRGPHNLGCIGTSVLGILGSFIGGTLFNSLSGNGFELHASGFFGAIFGATILLVIGRIVT
ncbi:MAG: GlsB/YeaQ/YmgE family stress response membrane protein [Actinomycetia bacterium]|nr:GlsB/YeaQ/YmgE family stress response membrane protein [Actinomycetes bacterium]